MEMINIQEDFDVFPKMLKIKCMLKIKTIMGIILCVIFFFTLKTPHNLFFPVSFSCKHDSSAQHGNAFNK